MLPVHFCKLAWALLFATTGALDKPTLGVPDIVYNTCSRNKDNAVSRIYTYLLVHPNRGKE